MKMTAKEQLSRKLKVLRAKKGMTQDDLAKASGVSKITIAIAEATGNNRIPSVDTLYKLAKALEVDEKEFVKFAK